MTPNRHATPWIFVPVFLVGCGGAPQGGPGGPGGGMPPSGVEVITLAAKPIEETNEFIATLKSRRSSVIQPQVEGFVTRIAVQSGERVAPGAVLFEVDASPQEAVVASQQSLRTARASELDFARQQATRARKLFEAGAASQRDAEEAETALRTAEAQLKAADEQVRQQRAELGYYKVTAPAAGVVGDIPVRVGDRATKSTMMTTLDGADGLEINMGIPLSQAHELRTGIDVHVLDEGKVVTTSRISFVSPSVDDATQTILAKAPLAAGFRQFRADQFVRVRVVWHNNPGLTVPVTAVTRVNGQYFAFTAEKGDKGGLVAKQRAVSVGDIVGNDYLVRDGLKEGQQLIVSGLQKIGDGAPVSVMPPATAAPATAPQATKGQ